MALDFERVSERAGLQTEPELLPALQVQLDALTGYERRLSELELPEGPVESSPMPTRRDLAMPVPSDPVLKGLPRDGDQVRLPGVPHAEKRKVAREIRPTRIERVSDGKELHLPSWPPTREDA
ncbi:MAG: hypothetical protein ACI9VR_000526 [Cognaticolwellia sp.]